MQVPDFPLAFPDMTVLRHISMCLRLYGATPDSRPQRIVDLLDKFDLLAFAEARLGTLSRGQLYKAVL
jgi:ABC-type multidrug transport system ATPase subunit